MACSGADDEGVPGGLDDVWGDGVEGVDVQDAPIWLMSRSMRRKLPPVIRTMLINASTSGSCSGLKTKPSRYQYSVSTGRRSLASKRQVVVGEPDPAVELRVAGQLSFEPGHPDQDHADVAAVEVVANLFQPSGFQPVRLVHNQQLGPFRAGGNDISGS